jgi:hypothetical protein
MVKAVDWHPMGQGFESCCPQFFFNKNYYQIGGSAAACKCNVAPSSSLKWHEIVIPTCKQIYISKLFSKVKINLFTIIWLHLITKGWYHIEVNYLICNQVLPWKALLGIKLSPHWFIIYLSSKNQFSGRDITACLPLQDCIVQTTSLLAYGRKFLRRAPRWRLDNKATGLRPDNSAVGRAACILAPLHASCPADVAGS